MRGMTTSRNRQPAGQPVGGQFSEKTKGSSGISLGPGPGSGPGSSGGNTAVQDELRQVTEALAVEQRGLDERKRVAHRAKFAVDVQSVLPDAAKVEWEAFSEMSDGYNDHVETQVAAVLDADGNNLYADATQPQRDQVGDMLDETDHAIDLPGARTSSTSQFARQGSVDLNAASEEYRRSSDARQFPHTSAL